MSGCVRRGAWAGQARHHAVGCGAREIPCDHHPAIMYRGLDNRRGNEFAIQADFNPGSEPFTRKLRQAQRIALAQADIDAIPANRRALMKIDLKAAWLQLEIAYLQGCRRHVRRTADQDPSRPGFRRIPTGGQSRKCAYKRKSHLDLPA